jgi:long-chain acyl-CoA synthetase
MALQRKVVEDWRAKTGSILIEGYGLTEASPVTHCNPLDGRDQTGTIGLPLPSTEVKLLKEDGSEITELNEPGEICVRGPQVMQGYWNRQEETDNVLDREGWLRTGDIAVWLDNGFSKIVDRKKDMINVSGFNVYPNEIEDVMAGHPGVKEVACIGVEDPKSNEAVKIIVVPRNWEVTAEDLDAYARQHLTGYKRPKYIQFRSEELPKSNVGKVLRRVLKEQDRAEAEQAAEGEEVHA